MRPLLGLLVALGASTVASAARADIVTSPERGADLALASYRVSGELVDGTVHLRVRYDVLNRSRFADRAAVQLELPASAVVVGLRQRVGGDWVPGRLLAADAAAGRFEAYLDAPFVAARGAALLTGDHGVHELALAHVPARGRVGVEYEAVVPACYARGEWLVIFPQLDDAPTLTAPGGRIEAAALTSKRLGVPVGDACVGFGVSDAQPDDVVLTWRGPSGPGAIGTVTSVRAASQTITAVDVAVAPRLAEVPRRAAVVFVIDASKSQGADGVADQLAIVRGYLAHAPDARVELVVVRRAARRLFGELVPAREVAARLAALPPQALAVGNGSHLDRGLELAATVLAAASGPRRLVAFTDDRLRPDLADADLRQALAPLPLDAVAHAILPTVGAAEVVRELDHHLVQVIDGWGGIVATVAGAGDPAPLLELVRPIRIEQLTLGGAPLVDEVREGDGYRHVAIDADAGAVAGLIWGRTWSPTVAAGPADRIRAGRLALGLGLALDDADVLALAHLTGAVTAFTSLLADRAAWTPGGLPDDGFEPAGVSISSICGGSSSTYGHSMPSVLVGQASLGPPRPELRSLLAERVAGCAVGLDADPWVLDVEVATTGVEVVDVVARARGVADLAAQVRFEACAIEAGWALNLDPGFARFTDTFTATFAR
ncbi:MAG: VWA domain-containing protein [Myxococcales bacterium]|nr:VWA domain-containing protein [Myxococcales bacterium]